MILPIVAYGHPVLRKAGEDISPDYPDLQKLIDDMWETMYYSNGVGLAAPQAPRDETRPAEPTDGADPPGERSDRGLSGGVSRIAGEGRHRRGPVAWDGSGCRVTPAS